MPHKKVEKKAENLVQNLPIQLSFLVSSTFPSEEKE